MDWYLILSYFLASGIRIFLGLFFVITLLRIEMAWNKRLILVTLGTILTTGVFITNGPQKLIVGIETLFLMIYFYQQERDQIRMCFYLLFYYEIGVALWDFLCSAGVGVLVQSEKFLKTTSLEHMAAVWCVRVLMILLTFLFLRQKQQGKTRQVQREFLWIAAVGMLAMIALGAQNRISINDDLSSNWMILSLVLMMSVMMYLMGQQYRVEKELVRVKSNQAQQLQQDYQELNKLYAANAKLFHDFHNHIGALQVLLAKGQKEEALEYLETLQRPIRTRMEQVWTKDEVIDYLINSKLAIANEQQVRTKINIEFPHNMGIDRVDLATIMGNLLDNALEATKQAPQEQRFLNLTIRRIHQMLVIKVENGCKEAPVMKQEELQTTKMEGGLHGWGIKSARTAAQKYDGSLETSYENHVFRVVVILSYDGVQN